MIQGPLCSPDGERYETKGSTIIVKPKGCGFTVTLYNTALDNGQETSWCWPWDKDELVAKVCRFAENVDCDPETLVLLEDHSLASLPSDVDEMDSAAELLMKRDQLLDAIAWKETEVDEMRAKLSDVRAELKRRKEDRHGAQVTTL